MSSLRRTAWGSIKFLLLTQSPWFFQPEDVGISWHWNPGLAGGAGVGLGLLAPEIFLLNYNLPHMDLGPAHSTSEPFLSV